MGRYSVLHFFYSSEKLLYFFLLLLCRCFKESLSAPHVIPCGVEKPLPANCSILSTLLNCFWCWHQTVLLSNLVFHSMFVTLGLGKPLARASLLPMREEEANEAENLSWKHRRSCSLPALLAEGKELLVHLTEGRSWEPFSSYFLNLKKNVMNPGLFFLVPVNRIPIRSSCFPWVYYILN